MASASNFSCEKDAMVRTRNDIPAPHYFSSCAVFLLLREQMESPRGPSIKLALGIEECSKGAMSLVPREESAGRAAA